MIQAKPGLVRMMARGLLKRCPLCGSRHIFESWSRMKHSCPRCGHVFELEQGYWVGAIIVNTAVTEAIFGILFIATLIATIPEVPWLPLLLVAVLTNTVIPIVFFPFSKTVWVAVNVFYTRARSG
jgi:uncharacterized protein (DUF983 family)